MTAWLRRIHKWLGLLIGIQFLLWMASGTLMSLLDSEKVAGTLSRMPKVASPAWPHDALAPDTVLAAQATPVRTLATGWLLGKPVFRLSSSSGTRLIEAVTGQVLVIDAGKARALALSSYAGPGDPGTPRLLGRTSEARKHKGNVWAIDFSDADETAVYVAADTGAIVAHRNSTWRLFDFFWMLHIMDYWEREDFNNPLLIGSGIGGLWLALSGIWLLITSLRLAEFVPARLRRTHTLQLFTEDGTKLRGATGNKGDTVFVVLAKSGVNLPSQCGGGQSCGLCLVRVRNNAPHPTSGDTAHISTGKLADGYRLACNLGLTSDIQLEIPSAATPGSVRAATVAGIRDLTPSMREIVLEVDSVTDPEFWPGSYVQIQIPPYELQSDALGAAGICIEQDERMPRAVLGNPIAARRCYSLSSPASTDKRTITLLVRLMGGPQSDSSQRFGVGSAYMFSLRSGDRIELAGPFGDFAVRELSREKIFIGGGAGMAPLRAMLRQLLANGDQSHIHFWYGARTLAETPYLAEMEELARKHGNFSWQLVLSDESVGTGVVLAGMVHQRVRELFLSHHADPATCDFYVCGPPAMLVATRSMLAEVGIPDERVSFDDFKI